MEKVPNKTGKIAWPVRNGDFVFCDFHEVTMCKAEGAYTHVHFENGDEITVAHRLKIVEQMLGGLPFFRIHDSYLINLTYAKGLKRENNQLLLHTSSFDLPVAKSRRKNLLQVFHTLRETSQDSETGG